MLYRNRFIQRYCERANLLSVRGNVLENGMPRFFRRLSEGVFDEADVKFRTDELVYFLRGFITRQGIDGKRIVALGYSNGANIAGGILLRCPDLLAGAVLLRPMQPLQQPEPFEATGQPVLMTSGTGDSLTTAEATQRYADLLTGGGYGVTHRTLPAGHNLVPQDISLATAWFAEHFAS